MLPDLPSLKANIQDVLNERLRTVAYANMGVLNEVPRVFVHEGNKMRTLRADGSVEDTEFKQSSVEMLIEGSDIPTMTAQQRLAMLDRAARELAGKVSKGVFESLNMTLAEAGQTVHSHGQPLSLQLMFETLEKIQMDFDEKGQPTGLQFVVGPELMPTILRLQEQFNNDSDAQRRHRELLDRKRMEWRAREATRKLVG